MYIFSINLNTNIICVFSQENKVAPSIQLNLVVLFPAYFINKFIENNVACAGNRALGFGHIKLASIFFQK